MWETKNSLPKTHRLAKNKTVEYGNPDSQIPRKKTVEYNNPDFQIPLLGTHTQLNNTTVVQLDSE